MPLSFYLKLFCLLVFSVTRWPLLQTAPTNVTQLPGFHGVLPFSLETGYVTVDRRIGSELFYYFIVSENEPSKDPVLLWLTGGPGCSSFYGLYQEIGPVRFKRIRCDETLPTLIYHPYTWTKMFNIIFLDWPPGSGFSFSKQFESQILDDDQSINQIYTFLKQWFVDHPSFLLNPFYVGGDSYGGKMTTLVSYKIAQGIEAFDQPLINFKGYLIGNPRTGIDEIDSNSRVPQAYELGIITQELKELIERNCAGQDYSFPRTALCSAYLQVFQKFIDEITIDNILSPKCIEDNAALKQKEGKTRTLFEEDHQTTPMSTSDLNCPVTVKKWNACNLQLKKNYMENIPSNLPNHHNLLSSFGLQGTMKWIEYLNFPVIEHWRSWKGSGQVAGYTVLYSNNLTLATVKGAGHEAPQDKPKECFTMLKRWLSYEPP